jgi:hypothetical protein
MFRNASVTFRTNRFGGEVVTDTFRVWFIQELFTDGQEDEVRIAVRDAGERDFEIIKWKFID